MYRVISSILSLPYAPQGFRHKPQSPDEATEWFKLDENTGGLTGFTLQEAGVLKGFLDKNAQRYFSSNNVAIIDQNELPRNVNQTNVGVHLPVIYPFDTFKGYLDSKRAPFEAEIIGYHRFLDK